MMNDGDPTEKRKLAFPVHQNPKRKKYSNLLGLILNSELNNDSKKEFEAFLKPKDDKDFDTEELHEALYYAASSRRTTWIEWLLEKGADPVLAIKNREQCDGTITTAVDEAWQNEDFDVVLQLIQADGPFPQSCSKTQLLAKTQLKDITRERLDLHKLIKSNNIDAVERFVNENPFIKRAYHIDNNSALTTALKTKSFEIYAFLRSNGFAVDDDHNREMENLGRKEKKILEIQIKKYFKTANIHILDLLSKSQLAPSNSRENFKIISELYETLDDIPECQPLLKIAASCDNLKIFFDFNREDIKELEPTTVFNNDKFLVRGRTYRELEVIEIAAFREQNELLGTLAQEFAHLALLKTYKNNFLPFMLGDHNQKSKYAKVIERCREIKNKNKVIESVFNYEDSKIEAELIVRAPQLLAMHEKSSDEIQQFREVYENLFSFYDSVVKEIEKEVVLNELKKKIQEVNKCFNLTNCRSKNVICTQNLNIDLNRILTGNDDIFIKTKTPEHIFDVLIEKSKVLDINSSMIFSYGRQLVLPDISHRLKNDFDRILKPTLVVLDSPEIDLYNLKNVLDMCKIRTVFVSSRSDDVFEDLLFENMDIEVNCGNLNEWGKEQIFHQTIMFQNEETQLKDIIFNFDIFDDVPLEKIAKTEINSLEHLEHLPDILVNRLFKSVGTCETFELDRVCNSLLKERVLILTGSKGMGKTVSTKNLIKNLSSFLPKRWIVFISLENIAYSHEVVPITPLFLSQKVLRLGNKFEEKLFEHFYESSRTLFVFDSFEAIDHRNNDSFINILKAVKKSGNILVVVTQPHFTDELEILLGIPSTELMPLGEKSQNQFLSKIILSSHPQLAENELKLKVESILNQFSPEEIKSLENPQILQKVAISNILNDDFENLILTSKCNKESVELFNMFIRQGAGVNVLNHFESNEPLLLKVLRKNQLEWIPFLLKNGASVRMVDLLLKNAFDERTATDIAWKNGKYEIVLQLLHADGVFPKGLIENHLSGETKYIFFELIQKRENFHKSIVLGQQEEIEKFIADNPNIKCAYNIENKCALSSGLEARSFKAYAFLRSRGFSKGIDDSHDEIMSSLTKSEFKSLEVEIRKLFKMPKTYIMDLVSKSCLGLNNEISFFDEIPKKFEALDEISVMQPILKIAASVPSLSIVFDFNRNHIHDFSVLKNYNNESEFQTFTKSGTILIGSKSNDESNVLGSLALELTFFALTFVFNNNGFPYYFDDEQRKSIFDEILKKYQKTSYSNKQIEAALAIELSVIPSISKLIVSHYGSKSDEIEKLRESLKDLFDFFENSLMKSFEIEVSLFETKRKVRGLNINFGLLQKFSSGEIKCVCPNQTIEEINLTSRTTLLQSNHPEFLLINLIAHLKKFGRGQVESMNIFVEIKQLLHLSVFDSMGKELDDCLQTAHPTLIVLNSSNLGNEESENVLGKYFHQGINVVLINNEVVKSAIFSRQYVVQFKWKDLRKKIKAILLETSLVFQNCKVLLKDLAAIDSKSFDELPIEQLLHSEHVEISIFNLPTPKGTYLLPLKRFFKSGQEKTLLLTANNVLEILETSRTLILAGSAGSGKTTAAVHFARTLKFENRFLWPIFINFYDFFYVKDALQNLASNKSLFEKIFPFLKSQYELNFLKYIFENSEIIFIFDGYEELSSCNMDYFHEILNMIQNRKYYTIITTKPHFLPYLREYVKGDVVEVAPLKKSEQIESLTFFSQRHLESNDISKTKVTAFLKRFSNVFPRIFAHRQNLLIISEIKFDEVNTFMLHDHIFDAKLKLFLKNKINTFDIIKIYQKIALESIFDTALVSSLPSIPNREIEKNTLDIMLDIGLVAVNAEKKCYFEHKTFAEHAAALYIYENITSDVNQSNEQVQTLFAKIILEKRYDFIKKSVENQNKDETINKIFFTEAFSECLNYDFIHDHKSHSTNIFKLLQMRNLNQSTNLQFELLKTSVISVKTFKMVWTLFEEKLEISDRKRILCLLRKERCDMNALLMNDLHNKQNIKFVLDLFRDMITAEEFSVTLLSKANWIIETLDKYASYADYDIFEMFWALLREKLKISEQKQILLQDDRYGINFFLSRGPDKAPKIKFVFDLFSDLFTGEEFTQIFHKSYWLIETLSYYAYSGEDDALKILWSLLREKLDISDLKRIFLLRDHNGENFFLISALHNKYILKFALDLYRELISAQEFSKIFHLRSNWITLTLETYARYADHDSFEKLWSLFREKLEISNRSMVLVKSAVLKLSVKNKNVSTLVFVLDLVRTLPDLDPAYFHDYAFYVFWLKQHDKEFVKKMHYEISEIRSFLLKKYFGFNLIFHSTELSFKKSQMLWKSILNYLNRNEIKNLLLARDELEGTPLDSAVSNSALKGNHVLMIFLEWLHSNFDHNELNLLFNLKYMRSYRLMHIVAAKSDDLLSKNFLQFVSENFTEQEKEKMLAERNDDGNNPVQISKGNWKIKEHWRWESLSNFNKT